MIEGPIITLNTGAGNSITFDLRDVARVILRDSKTYPDGKQVCLVFYSPPGEMVIDNSTRQESEGLYTEVSNAWTKWRLSKKYRP